MSDESQISEREREILRLVATGATNQQIAQQLHISINTVKVHLRNIFGKIGAASRTEATLYAVRSGLVTVERAGSATAIADGPDDLGPAGLAEPSDSRSSTALAENPDQRTPAAVAEPSPPLRSPATEEPFPPSAGPSAAGAADATAHGEPPAAPSTPVAVAADAALAPATPTDVALPVAASAPAELRPAAASEPAALAALPVERSPSPPVVVIPAPGTPVAGESRPAERGRLSPLLIGLAAVALLALGGLLATLLRPVVTAPSATPAPEGDVSLPAPGERWRAVAPIPAPRAEFALAPVGFGGANYLYLIGGDGPEGVTGDVLRYDLAGNSWARYTAKPTPVADVRAAVVGGRIFVPGGRTADGTISAAVEVYDPQADRWTTAAPMPAPRSRYALAALEGKLYLFGGWDGTEYAAQVWQYSPETDRWVELTAMPAPRAGAAAVELDGQVFLIGGENRDGPLSRHDRYTPAEEGQGNPWAVRAPLPSPRSNIAAAGTSNLIFLFGGSGGSLIYNVSRDVWEPLTLPDDLNRTGLSAEFGTDNKVYIIGGRGQDGISDQAFEYQALFVVTLPVSR